MRSRTRLRAMVILLAPLAFACGKKEERPPATVPPASPTPGAAATATPAGESLPAMTATPPPGARTGAPVDSRAAQPLATAAPKAPETTPTPPPTTDEKKPTETSPVPLPRPAAPRPQGKITLPAKLGAVTFDHEKHAGKQGIACTTCHHSNRPQKPLASEHQACGDCHTMPAAPPMKTSLQAAFHDPRGATGTCIDCHKQKGGPAPAKCLDCHKKR